MAARARLPGRRGLMSHSPGVVRATLNSCFAGVHVAHSRHVNDSCMRVSAVKRSVDGRGAFTNLRMDYHDSQKWELVYRQEIRFYFRLYHHKFIMDSEQPQVSEHVLIFTNFSATADRTKNLVKNPNTPFISANKARAYMQL